MIYEHCLEDRSNILNSIFGTAATPTVLPPEGSTVTLGPNESAIMPSLPECDLQKELDNVSCFHSYTYISPLNTFIEINKKTKTNFYYINQHKKANYFQ